MPITSLFCPCVGGEVPLDHYRSGRCPKPPMPLPWIFGISANTFEGGDRHPPMQMSASRVSACPRSGAIADLLPVPRVDLRKFNQAAFGWAGHAFMYAHTPPEMLAEHEMHGTFFKDTPYEIYMAGHCDVIRPGGAEGTLVFLEDYKFTSDANQRYVTGVTEKAEWNVQLTVYSRLAGFQIDGAAIWSGAPSPARSSAAPWVRIPARVLSDEELLAAVPYEGASTVADHIIDFKTLQERLQQGMPPEEAIAAMPLRGEMQWRRKDKSKCDYCTQSDVCGQLARGSATGEI